MPSRNSHRAGRTRVAAAIVVLGILAVACAPDGPTADELNAQFDPYDKPQYTPPEDGPFERGECPTKTKSHDTVRIICGTLEVPKVHEDPSLGTDKLAVALLLSDNPEVAEEPIVYLDGGPGGSSIGLIDFWLELGGDLLDNHHVILVDQRGTGYSEPRMDCDNNWRRTYHPAYQSIADVYRVCAYSKRELGHDFAHYNSFSNAKDFKLLREALEFDKWDVIGVSYGTRLGLALMATDPEGIDSVVLDSTYPMGVDAYVEQTPNGWRAFKQLFDGCAADPACNEAYPNLEARFLETIDRLNGEPVEVDISYVWEEDEDLVFVHGDVLVDLLFGALYSTELLPYLPLGIHLIANNDPRGVRILAGIEQVLDEKDLAKPGNPALVSDGMHYAVQCHEEAPFQDLGAVQGAASGVPSQVASIMTVGAEQIGTVCPVIGTDATKQNIDDLIPLINREIPTLVLAGTYDPITPPAWGEKAANELVPGATYRLFDGVGHGVIAAECGMSIVSDFFDDPESFDPDKCTTDPPQWVLDDEGPPDPNQDEKKSDDDS